MNSPLRLAAPLVLASLVLGLSACKSETHDEATAEAADQAAEQAAPAEPGAPIIEGIEGLATGRDQVSYMIGLDMAKSLAPIKDSLQIPRCESGFELVVSAVFISWWVGLISFPTAIFHDGVALPFKLSAAWQPYWWGILLLAVMDLVLAAANWLRPYWKWDRLLLRMLLNVISLVLVYTLFQQDELVVLANATAEGEPAKIVGYINQAVHGVLVFIGIVALIELAQDARRLLVLR